MRHRVGRGALRTFLPALLIVLFMSAVSAQAGGVPAPGLTLTLLDGKTLRLADMKGSPVVLLFWAPWCTMCQGEAPGWERAYRQYKGTGVQIVGICMMGAHRRCEEFVRRYGLTFPNAFDPNGDVGRLYGFNFQPYWAVIARGGTLVRTGFLPDAGVLVPTIKTLARR